MVNVRHLAELAHICMPDDEIEKLTDDMESIMWLMDGIKEVQLPEDIAANDGVSMVSLRPDEVRPFAGESTLVEFAIPKLMEN